MKIRLKQIILLLATSLFLTSSLSFIIYQNQKKALTKHVYAHLESVSEAKLLRIKSMLKEIYEIAIFPTHNNVIISNLEKYQEYADPGFQENITKLLKEYALHISSFQRIHILSNQGKIIASSDSSYVDKDWSARENFRIASTGRTFLDDFHFTGNNWNVFIFAPIFSSQKRVGVVVIDYKANDFLTLTNDYVGLGKTGETVLAKKKGDTIYYLTPVRHIQEVAYKKNISSKDSLVEMNILLDTKKNLITETKDYRGVEVLASGRYIEEMGWGMVTTIDLTEAMKSVHELKETMLLFNAGVVFLAIIIAYIAGTFFTKPLEALKESADKISKGDLYHRTKPSSTTLEIKALSKSFNRMAERLSSKIQETESFSAKVLEAAMHGIVVLKSVRNFNGEIIDFKYLLINNAAEKILGRPKEDLLGKQWLEEFPKFKNLGLLDIQKRVVETGISESIEFFDDEENVNRWFRNGYIKFKDGLLITRDDISGLKEANIQFEKAQQFLLDSQAIAQAGSFDWDIINDKITGTPEYLRLFSYEKKYHTLNDFLDRVHPQDRENVKQAIDNTLENKGPFDVKFSIIRPNGSMRFFWGRAHAYFDKNGKATRMMGAVTNISKLKETEIELHKAKDDLQLININLEERVKNRTQELSVVIKQLKSTNERLDKFAYVISHDLKAPINAIEGLVNIIQDEYTSKPFDQEAEEIMGMMHTTIDNMRNLIDGVLKSAKDKKNAKEPIELYSLTQQVIHTLNPPKYFHIFIQHTLPMVYYNRIALLQILQNLISNAIKYMDKEDPLIKIGSVEHDLYYQIYITDNGPGIAAELHTEIFKIFETAHHDTTKDSHGVGLSIVKQLVEQHQGKIWVESEIGKETSFHFTIPKE